MISIGSLYSGVGGFELGFEGIGEVVYQAEKDKYCQALLKQKFPNAHLFETAEDAAKSTFRPRIVVGGFPCQPHSLAGKRGASSDERDGWETVRETLENQRPEWFLFENVPDLLSSEDGRYFAKIVEDVVKLGYGLCWRVLNSQNFGVPQRRRRLFLVGHLGDATGPARVLFEPESMSGDSSPRKKKGSEVAATITADAGKRRPGRRQEDDVNIVYQCHGSNVGPMGVLKGCSESNGVPFLAQTLSPSVTGRSDCSAGKNGGNPINLIPYTMQAFGEYKNLNLASTLKTRDAKDAKDATDLIAGTVVRRLTPRECERLQGFPDDWTDNGQSNSQRYRQMGNAVTVNVIRWIAKRMEKELVQ